MDAIVLDDLSKSYTVKARDEGISNALKSLIKPRYKTIEAVKNISFNVAKGEMIAFIGPNGAGKSTTIKMLTGILYPTSGKASVLGLDPVKDRKKLVFDIGAVFGQRSQLSFHLPPVDSFRLLSSVYEINKETYQQRLKKLSHMLEIDEFMDQPVRKLSLGQRIRCEFAASLLHSPKILFLDEPTIGLDVVVKHKIRELILRMNKEESVTVFLTSHDAGDIENLCRRAIVIDHGRVALDIPVKKLKYDYLDQKVISVKFNQPASINVTEGMTMIKSTPYAAKFTIDTRVMPVGRVFSTLDADNIADITITEPPMEEIIASIYESNAKSGATDE